MRDPYQVLGISPSASDDDVKKAYRSLAKKYHPDVNNGSKDAELRMKEINEAYSAILKMRREGSSYSSAYGGAYAGGYNPYGAGAQGYHAGGGQQSPQLQAARNYVQAGYYREALNTLSQITERSAEWYYLSALANSGLGNRVAALDHARQAVALQPDSFEYRQLLDYLENGIGGYRRAAQTYGFGDFNQSLCWSALATACCLGGCGFPCFCCI